MTAPTNTAPGSAGQNGAHTPGPWHRFDNGGLMCLIGGEEHYYGESYADCVWGPLGPGHGLIADCSPHGQAPTAETIANARLIAAAPQMIEALCLAHDYLAGNGWEGDPRMQPILAAIAAATGEGK